MIEKIKDVLRKYWGYDRFLPLQEEAMELVGQGRDSVVVLPTGGGKSLCFQAPAVALPGMAVVVSPLISLMKDQVDGLCECGVRAARLDSSLHQRQQSAIIAEIEDKVLKILYVSPERILSEGFVDLLKKTELSLIAVDEAHCVSMWGHDFRPEYRQLGILKDTFHGIAVHAYTATATEQVRLDIAEQLHLDSPEILVGSFDRPNLVYRVERRTDTLKQVREVLDRHKGESGIIYCIRRSDVDQMCAVLSEKGYRAVPYHAGMADDDRKKNQDAFIQEDVETMVATVAFGMGIDKSNVRYVVHAGMPKSLEHYHQETGRAGRDGLEAECCLLYSSGDYGLWIGIQSELEGEAKEIARSKLADMYSYCTGAVCRHRSILRYFAQELDKDNCGACDVCLGGVEWMEDPLPTAQKILSCVVRLREQFGIGHVVLVLSGSRDHRILENGHDKLSTYGLLSECKRQVVRDWIEQLVGQEYLERVGEFNVLQVTKKGWSAIRGEGNPQLSKPPKKVEERAARVSRRFQDSWIGVDQGLFERLRQLRRESADAKDVPAYIVFGDAALRDMARRRPSTREGFLQVNGVGERKCEQYAHLFLEAIRQYCEANAVGMDVESDPATVAASSLSRTVGPSSSSLAKSAAFELFGQGRTIEEVAQSVGRAPSTVYQYLEEYIRENKIEVPSPWVEDDTARGVAEAARVVGIDRLRPIFEFLKGEVSYEEIRICVACLRNIAERS